MYKKIFKRILDLLFGVVIGAILIIPIMLIYVLIVLMEGKPGIFKQIRIGQNEKPFCIYKFRTMVNNAEMIGPQCTKIGDKRITKIGKFLRKTSLDELPQILNIIKGDMSFVGFRPGVPENYKDTDYHSRMFDVKPGITGYAQVNGRSSMTLEEKRKWEQKYIQDISFKTDLKIIFKTIVCVLKRSGVT
ncbi:sugar transferase [Gallibacter sp. Marseille-QA0791]|uniref:sugar transferase n=1 Tax=Gallibacter sp. Marseille-QA0791 TaxID=3378781 RepID=UPI003D137337